MSPGRPDDADTFVSLVAHELKTPLTPLKAVAQLIRSRIRKAREGARELDVDALERSVVMLERQVDRMDRLVTGLLEVSRLSRGTFELHVAPLDLAASVRDAARRWGETLAEDGRHVVEIDAPAAVLVSADRERVDLVVDGLIGNAVKFSPRGGAVRVTLEAREGAAVLTVRDDGIGIPADEVGSLGRGPFVRGARASGYAGVGAGLYLARRVAEAHGGGLELESDGSDRGTTARLRLPLA